MKSLEKDRDRRYATPGSFAEDIERYLRHEAILARPPSRIYRLKKLAQRNRAAMLTTAVVAVALLAGTALATWQAFRAKRAETKALVAAAREKEAKEDALARESEIKAVLGFVENRIFAAARPEGQSGGLGSAVSLRKAIESALPFVDQSFPNQPLIEARLRLTLGRSFYFLGDARTAAEQELTARALYTQHLGSDNPDTLLSMNDLGDSYHTLGRHAEALVLREETLAHRKARLGPDHRDTLVSMHNLAASYYALGRHVEALNLREETLARQKSTLGPDHPDTLLTMNNLAGSYFALGRPADALKLIKETLALRKARLGVDHPDTLRSMNNLAICYGALGLHADAVKLNEETLALRRAKLGIGHPDTLMSMNNLADAYAHLGRQAEALKLGEETLALQKAKFGVDHPDTLMSMHNLGDSNFALCRYAEALKLREETLALRKAKLGADHPDTLLSMSGLAESLIKAGRGAEAVSLIDQCVRLASGKAVDPHVLPQVIDLRLRYFEKLKDPTGCRQTAAMWEQLKRTDVESLYKTACVHAVIASVLRAAGKSAATANQAETEADVAIAWLKQAIAAGYKDAAQLKKENDLNSLHNRDDFKKLVAELERPRAKP
jgi:non-specific serine/threonine protein kinase/serine/threonine-protein kinase